MFFRYEVGSFFNILSILIYTNYMSSIKQDVFSAQALINAFYQRINAFESNTQLENIYGQIGDVDTLLKIKNSISHKIRTILDAKNLSGEIAISIQELGKSWQKLECLLSKEQKVDETFKIRIHSLKDNIVSTHQKVSCAAKEKIEKTVNDSGYEIELTGKEQLKRYLSFTKKRAEGIQKLATRQRKTIRLLQKTFFSIRQQAYGKNVFEKAKTLDWAITNAQQMCRLMLLELSKQKNPRENLPECFDDYVKKNEDKFSAFLILLSQSNSDFAEKLLLESEPDLSDDEKKLQQDLNELVSSIKTTYKKGTCKPYDVLDAQDFVDMSLLLKPLVSNTIPLDRNGVNFLIQEKQIGHAFIYALKIPDDTAREMAIKALITYIPQHVLDFELTEDQFDKVSILLKSFNKGEEKDVLLAFVGKAYAALGKTDQLLSLKNEFFKESKYFSMLKKHLWHSTAKNGKIDEALIYVLNLPEKWVNAIVSSFINRWRFESETIISLNNIDLILDAIGSNGYKLGDNKKRLLTLFTVELGLLGDCDKILTLKKKLANKDEYYQMLLEAVEKISEKSIDKAITLINHIPHRFYSSCFFNGFFNNLIKSDPHLIKYQNEAKKFALIEEKIDSEQAVNYSCDKWIKIAQALTTTNPKYALELLKKVKDKTPKLKPYFIASLISTASLLDLEFAVKIAREHQVHYQVKCAVLHVIKNGHATHPLLIQPLIEEMEKYANSCSEKVHSINIYTILAEIFFRKNPPLAEKYLTLIREKNASAYAGALVYIAMKLAKKNFEELKAFLPRVISGIRERHSDDDLYDTAKIALLNMYLAEGFSTFSPAYDDMLHRLSNNKMLPEYSYGYRFHYPSEKADSVFLAHIASYVAEQDPERAQEVAAFIPDHAIKNAFSDQLREEPIEKTSTAAAIEDEDAVELEDLEQIKTETQPHLQSTQESQPLMPQVNLLRKNGDSVSLVSSKDSVEFPEHAQFLVTPPQMVPSTQTKQSQPLNLKESLQGIQESFENVVKSTDKEMQKTWRGKLANRINSLLRRLKLDKYFKVNFTSPFKSKIAVEVAGISRSIIVEYFKSAENLKKLSEEDKNQITALYKRLSENVKTKKQRRQIAAYQKDVNAHLA